MNYIAKQVVETEDAVGRESKVDESRKFGEFCSHQEIASEIRQSIRTEVSTRSGYISSKLEGNLLANSALGFAFTAAIFFMLPLMHILGQLNMKTREVVTMESSEAPPPYPVCRNWPGVPSLNHRHSGRGGQTTPTDRGDN